MSEIKVSDIFPLEDLTQYKLHCAVWNKQDEPLDVFVRDRREWQSWNNWKGAKNEFNRKYIFSMMRFYPEENIWLFGGIFEVLGFEGEGYTTKLTDKGADFIGRLKLRYRPVGRNIRRKLEGSFEEFVVSEILKEPYTGQLFRGYEEIDLTFRQLDEIVKNQRPDWRGALQNIKGVYLITDQQNGKKYVGSAYGEFGIWSRWECYLRTGHGWNDGMTKLIKEKGIDYARENFKFTLLEYRPTKVDDQVLIDREVFWKKALLTRGDYGYNKN